MDAGVRRIEATGEAGTEKEEGREKDRRLNVVLQTKGVCGRGSPSLSPSTSVFLCGTLAGLRFFLPFLAARGSLSSSPSLGGVCTRTVRVAHACVSRVFVGRRPRDAEGRIFFRMGYLTRWPGQ